MAAACIGLSYTSGMDFNELLRPVSRFCRDRIEPTAEKDDETKTFRMDLYRGLADLGVSAAIVDEAYEGLSLGDRAFALILQEIAKTSVAYAVSFSVTGMVQHILSRWGSEAQKKTYLPLLVSGKKLGVFGLTEPTSGSDASALATKFRKEKNGYVLNGSKQFCTNGGTDALHVVFARDESGTESKKISAFLVPSGTPGFSVGKLENKMGWRASHTAALHFDQCHVPSDALIGEIGQGFKIAMGCLDSGRINISSIAIGLSQRALGDARDYACQRKQFGVPIIQFEGVGFLLADMMTLIEAGSALLDRVLTLKEKNEPINHLSSALKCFTTDNVMKITSDAVQVFGGYGYMKDYPVERFMRDAKVLQIVEGTNQIQRLVMMRYLEKNGSPVHP